jgi:hypothetical protein
MCRLSILSRPGTAVILLAMVALPTTASGTGDGMQVAGWIEKALLLPSGVSVRAKLDSGAKTSSINTVDPVFFNRNRAPWVRFSLTNGKGRKAVLEQPIIRTASIKRLLGRVQKRPVIRLDICLGHARKTVEVNLMDRTGMNYQLLVGRNFLHDTFLVHPGQTYLLNQDCPGS